MIDKENKIILCPYCMVKDKATTKTTFTVVNKQNGRCKCGAFIDAGQQTVSINGYADIYKGAVSLIEEVVEQFNNYLDYFDIDIEDYMGEEANINITLNTTEIIRKLFTPYYGYTTVCNVKNALGIKESEVGFEVHRKEFEP